MLQPAEEWSVKLFPNNAQECQCLVCITKCVEMGIKLIEKYIIVFTLGSVLLLI